MNFPREDFFIDIKSRDHAWSMSKFHYHNSYEIFYIASGVRTILYDGKIYDLHAGDMILFCPNSLHRGTGNAAHKKIDIEFSKKFLDYYFTASMQEELLSCFKNISFHLNEEEQKSFETLSQKLNDEYAENDLYAVTLSSILQLVSRAQNRYKNETSISRRLQSQMPEKIKIVLSYIEENFANIKSIDEIANHAYLNKSYLCRLFKKETSMTVMDYLYDYRVLQACEMLSSTDKSVGEIALLCGFGNTSHFIKTFKSMLDCTPGKFRKNNK
jgi:AraC-like DNA-binding protein